MMKTITQFALLILVFAFSMGLKAESAADQGYEILKPAQPTEDPDKVEVIEFFWYGCPHCYAFEPALNKWKKTMPDNVLFIRQPAIFSSLWGKHAQAFFTAQALGVEDKVHADFFDAILNKKQKLTNEDELAKFFVAHGVDEAEFRKQYNSFWVDTKMRQAKTMAARYGVTGVPAIIINGKYKTSGSLAKSLDDVIVVMDRLIKKESK